MVDCLNPRYEFKEFNNETLPIEVTTNPYGSLWLIAGTDSGFEGKTALYYSLVKIKISEKQMQ